jgi:hypothetical protein
MIHSKRTTSTNQNLSSTQGMLTVHFCCPIDRRNILKFNQIEFSDHSRLLEVPRSGRFQQEPGLRVIAPSGASPHAATKRSQLTRWLWRFDRLRSPFPCGRLSLGDIVS